MESFQGRLGPCNWLDRKKKVCKDAEELQMSLGDLRGFGCIAGEI